MNPLVLKALNFTGAVAAHIMNGFKCVLDDTYRKRLDLCETCELKDKEKWVCNHPECGCDLLWKARWAEQECPLKKWNSTLKSPKTRCCGN